MWAGEQQVAIEVHDCIDGEHVFSWRLPWGVGKVLCSEPSYDEFGAGVTDFWAPR